MRGIGGVGEGATTRVRSQGDQIEGVTERLPVHKIEGPFGSDPDVIGSELLTVGEGQAPVLRAEDGQPAVLSGRIAEGVVEEIIEAVAIAVCASGSSEGNGIAGVRVAVEAEAGAPVLSEGRIGVGGRGDEDEAGAQPVGSGRPGGSVVEAKVHDRAVGRVFQFYAITIVVEERPIRELAGDGKTDAVH